VNVERDDNPADHPEDKENCPEGCVTIYFEETGDGRTWYITLNNTELALIKAVV
jgi:hypothetical protein